MKQSPLTLAAGCIVVATIGLVVGILVMGVTDQYAANRDFIEYWASGQQLLHHGNPYDANAILRLQQAAGMQDTEPQITLSPPVALCWLLPLGLVSPKTGLVLWMLALIASLLLSIWLIWVLSGRPDNGYHLCGENVRPDRGMSAAGSDRNLSSSWSRTVSFPGGPLALSCRGRSSCLCLETAPVSAVLHRSVAAIAGPKRFPSSPASRPPC